MRAFMTVMLAMAIGMLVDAAVVVVENVVTHMASRGGGAKLPRLHLIYRAAREVALPVASGISIIIIVFLPLLTLQGLEGKLFIPVALTIVFALSASLVLSLTVIPVLASYLIGTVSHAEPRLVALLQRGYRPALAWAMAHSRTVTAAALGLLVLTGVLYTQIGKSFMPTMDEGDLIVQLEKLPSINLAESLAIVGGSRKGELAVTLTTSRGGLDVAVTGGKPLDGPLPPLDISDSYGLDLTEVEQ